MYTLTFMGGSVYTGFASLYWAHVGLNPAEIGLLGALGALAALIFQPWWGSVNDRSSSTLLMLRLTMLASVLGLVLVFLSGNSLYLLIPGLMAFTAVNNSVGPLSDALSLSLARQHGFGFTRIRMAGSLGFALMSAVAGLLFNQRIWLLFVVFGLTRLGALAATIGLPQSKSHAAATGGAMKFRTLFKDRGLVLMYALSLVLATSWAFMLNFHGLQSVAKGIDLGLIGLCIGLGSLSQFPFMAWFQKLKKRFGLRRIMIFSGTMYGLRMLVFGYFLDSWTIIPLWLLHGTNFILVYLCLAEYVQDRVAVQLHARGHMANAMILGSLGTILGSFLGGLGSSLFGMSSTFGVFAGLCLLGTGAFMLVTRKDMV